MRNGKKTLTHNYNRLEADMNCKTTEINMKRLFVKSLQNISEKEREPKYTNESKRCAPKRTDMLKMNHFCANELQHPTLWWKNEDEPRYLRETFKELIMQNESEEIMVNAYRSELFC
jgi:hypothetical protein